MVEPITPKGSTLKPSNMAEELAVWMSMDSASFRVPLYGFVGLDVTEEFLDLDRQQGSTLPFGDPAVSFVGELCIGATIQKIEPEYEVKELANYIAEPNLISHLMRFMDGKIPFCFELVLNNRNIMIDSGHLDESWKINDPVEYAKFVLTHFLTAMAAMRIRGLRFIAPVILNCPLDSFRKVPDKFIERIMGYPFEDKNSSIVDIHNGPPMTTEDIEWIRKHSDWFWDWIQSEEKVHTFSVAYQALCCDQSIDDLNMRCAMYWIGIESILKLPPYGIAKNLIHRVTELLPSYSKKQIRSMWNMRCKTIHGQGVDSGDYMPRQQLENNELRKVTEQSRMLLCEIMQQFIEEDFLPTRKNIDDRFGVILPDEQKP